MEVNHPYLGLDVGDRRIGVAVSDAGGILASPVTIVLRTRDEAKAVNAITDLAKQYQVTRIIVGLPISMDGSIGEQAEKVKEFTELLRRHTEIPIEFRDERLSTVSVKRMMQSVRKTHNTRNDAMAAAIILQSYLEESRE